MATGPAPTAPPTAPEETLERDGLIYLPACPFALPEGDEREFLFRQQLVAGRHKNISYDPTSGRLTGFRRQSAAQADRLRGALATFGERATAWLSGFLPRYAGAWRRDRVSFRPLEEATRPLRLTARNDLLHVDAFPSRPSGGDRILRLFVNVNPTDPRVWVTAQGFAELFARYGQQAGLPSAAPPGLARRVGQGLIGLFDPARRRRTAYDAFMLRFHDFLKGHEPFQERAPRRYWKFAPGSAWLVFADSLSHAVLRGQFALEHSFFVPPAVLLRPESSPAAVLERACGSPVLRPAA